jgi:tripartite-type tricarboxylate transporter receptor subunit TctC
LLGGPPLALVVHPSVQVKDVKEFIAYANAQPGGLSYATPGAGTHNHLMGELFRSKTGTNLIHISYKGGGPAVTDMISGHVVAGFLTLSTAAPHIKTGKLRALAITSEKRLPEYTTVPTFAEAGYQYLTTNNWSGISGPAGMPAAIVNLLNSEVLKALRSPDMRERLQAEGIEPNEMNSAAFTSFFRKEIDHWSPVAKSISLKLGN